MTAFAAEPISPELCLVCPELRDRALALLDDSAPAAHRELLPPLPVRIGAYLVLRTTRTALECAWFAAAIAALVLVLSLA